MSLLVIKLKYMHTLYDQKMYVNSYSFLVSKVYKINQIRLFYIYIYIFLL